MSRSLRRMRSARPVALAALAATALTLSLTGSAQASFSTPECTGSQIKGAGASFQGTAQNSLWRPTSLFTYCQSDFSVTPASPTALVNTYDTPGSGAGITAVKTRNAAYRYAGSDDPLSDTDIAAINAGDATSTADDAKIRSIPVAVGAVGVVVNVPNLAAGGVAGAGAPCLIPDAQLDTPGTPNTARLKLTQDQVEKIFRGVDTKWADLVPNITANPSDSGGVNDTFCKNFPLRRAVRFDSSGTTYILKDFLRTVNGSTVSGSLTWRDLASTNELLNRSWPGNATLPAFDYNQDGDTADAGEAAGASQTVNAGANGGGALRGLVASTDGAIGYLALSDARGGGGTFTRTSGTTDDTYWAPIGKSGQDKTTPTDYTDPNVKPNGYLSTATTAADKGSNCATTTVSGVPAGGSAADGTDATTKAWAGASVANTGDYAICGLTYVLAFDDYKGAYSLTQAGYSDATEEPRARTVKDYLTAILKYGQDQDADPAKTLSGNDYSPLPASLLTISKAAVAAMDFGKTPSNNGGGGGNNNGGGGGNGGGTTTPTGGGTTTPPPAATVSNAFTLSKPRSSAGNILLTFQLPGAGTIDVVAKAKVKGKTITVARGTGSRTSGGTAKLTLKPSSAARKALKKNSLKVTITSTFTPTGGTAKTTTSSLTLKKK